MLGAWLDDAVTELYELTQKNGQAAADPFAQTVHDDAPDGDDDPIGHFVHITDPVEHAYVPAQQGAHRDPALGE